MAMDQFNGHEFEQALEVGDGQGSLNVLQSRGSQRTKYISVCQA